MAAWRLTISPTSRMGCLWAANGDAFSQTYTTNGDVRIGFYSLGLYFQDEYRVTPN